MKEKTAWYNRSSILFLVMMLVDCGYDYSVLPEVIPIHFNEKGITDGYGPKGMIWSLPAIAFFIFLLDWFIIRAMQNTSLKTQRKWSSGMKGKSDQFILETNAHNVAQMALLNLIVIIVFAYLLVATIQAALTDKPGINPFITWGLTALIFVPIIKMVLFSLRED